MPATGKWAADLVFRMVVGTGVDPATRWPRRQVSSSEPRLCPSTAAGRDRSAIGGFELLGDVSACVEDAPHVDKVVGLDVEDRVVEALDWKRS